MVKAVLVLLLLLALPALWCVVEYRGGLGFFERRTVDWRFQVRGEMPSPVKIVYVDVDSLSLSRMFSRSLSVCDAAAILSYSSAFLRRSA